MSQIIYRSRNLTTIGDLKVLWKVFTLILKSAAYSLPLVKIHRMGLDIHQKMRVKLGIVFWTNIEVPDRAVFLGFYSV